MRYLERPMAFSTSPKFKVIRFEFESVTSLDDCIDELVEQGNENLFNLYYYYCYYFDYLDFFRTHQWPNEQQSVKYLLFFANVQNSVGTDILNLLLNSESISDTCQKLYYSREEDSSN
jgi:hypothetical protein